MNPSIENPAAPHVDADDRHVLAEVATAIVTTTNDPKPPGAPSNLPAPAEDENASEIASPDDTRSTDDLALAIDETETSPAPTEPPGELDQTIAVGPYEIRASGAWHTTQNPTQSPDQRLSDRLAMVAWVRSKAGDEWSKLLEFTDRDGCTKRWTMPMSMLASRRTEIFSTLMGQGWGKEIGAAIDSLLYDFLNKIDSPRRFTSTKSIGWHGQGFLLPDAWFGPKDEDFLLDGGDEGNHAFRTAGTLAEWQSSVAALCVGNSRLALAVSMAFAAPLMHLLTENSGGFHLVGSSSTGKTTALRVAGSVWGGGQKDGYLKTWNATTNGLESVATLHNDALLVLDEMGQADPRDIGKTVYMLANGAGKGRMSKDITARKSATWRTLFLSSGEIGLGDHLKSAGKVMRAGQDVRLVNIEADAGQGMGLFEDLHGAVSPDAFAQTLAAATTANCGVASREFLTLLTTTTQKSLATTRKTISEFVDAHRPAGASGEVCRVLNRFALVAAAGELATEFGILPWPQGEATRAAATCFRAWLTNRGGAGSGDEAAAVAQVRLYIEQHGDSRFARLEERPDGFDTTIVLGSAINRAGIVREDQGEKQFLIFGEAFKSEVCKGFDPRMVARALEDRGYLQRGQKDRYTTKVSVPGFSSRLEMYLVKGAILEAC